MKVPEFEIKLSIDNTYLQPCEIGFLLQKDPFPGGHTYELTISNIETQKYFSFVSIGDHENLTEKSCAEIAYTITNLIEWIGDYQQIPNNKKFLLNTIETLDIRSNEIYLDGQCSEIVKFSKS